MGQRYPPLHSHRTVTRAQGADSVLTFGAALWSALLEVRDAGHDDEQQATARRSVIDQAGDVLEEVHAKSDGLTGAVQPLGDAVFVFAAHVERGGDTPRVEIATCLEDCAWLVVRCDRVHGRAAARRPVRRAGRLTGRIRLVDIAALPRPAPSAVAHTPAPRR